MPLHTVRHMALVLVLATATASGRDRGSLHAQPPSLRADVIGRSEALSSDHVLATATGAEVLRRGGNAVDAAIAMAGVLAVVRPHMNGVGGDLFMLYRDARTGRVYALNGSGAAGSGATLATLRARNLTRMPSSGIMSVSVPGAVRAWEDALRRFGTTTLARALAPAVEYAEKGFPVSTRLSLDIAAELRKVSADPELTRTYLVNGAAPTPGTLLIQRDLAQTLRAIQRGGSRVLYGGPLGARIAGFIEREGGFVAARDLAAHRSEWTQPIRTSYLDKQVLAFPPNTQGVTLLQMLNLASLDDVTAMGHNTADYIHTLVEGAKLAYAERDKWIADPRVTPVPVDRLLTPAHARELRARIRRDSVVAPSSGERPNGNGDTVYLCVIDRHGNAVSLIQSLFASFGSGRMAPGTGIVLHNRGALFELDASHPNVVAPGKRPFHTLSPAMVLEADGALSMVLGSPGGDGQPQTLMQILNNVLRFGMTPQQAVEAPRWRIYGASRLGVEPGVHDSVRTRLTARGHQVALQPPSAEFGGAQMIWVHPQSRALLVGSDYRREAYGLAR